MDKWWVCWSNTFCKQSNTHVHDDDCLGFADDHVCSPVLNLVCWQNKLFSYGDDKKIIKWTLKVSCKWTNVYVRMCTCIDRADRLDNTDDDATETNMFVECQRTLHRWTDRTDERQPSVGFDRRVVIVIMKFLMSTLKFLTAMWRLAFPIKDTGTECKPDCMSQTRLCLYPNQLAPKNYCFHHATPRTHTHVHACQQQLWTKINM